jgi:hypothetical protein
MTDRAGGTKDISAKESRQQPKFPPASLFLQVLSGRGLCGQPRRAVGLADLHAGLGDRAGDPDDLSGDPAGPGECLADPVRAVQGLPLIGHPAGDLVDHPEGLCGPRGCRGDLPECLDCLYAGRGCLLELLLPLYHRSVPRRAVVLPRG